MPLPCLSPLTVLWRGESRWKWIERESPSAKMWIMKDDEKLSGLRLRFGGGKCEGCWREENRATEEREKVGVFMEEERWYKKLIFEKSDCHPPAIDLPRNRIEWILEAKTRTHRDILPLKNLNSITHLHVAPFEWLIFIHPSCFVYVWKKYPSKGRSTLGLVVTSRALSSEPFLYPTFHFHHNF